MKIIDEELFRMWGGGIDYALSSDFKDLSDDEKDALYERYKVNLAKQAKQAIQALIDRECNKARIEELEEVIKRNNYGMTKSQLGTLDRIAELSNRENK